MASLDYIDVKFRLTIRARLPMLPPEPPKPHPGMLKQCDPRIADLDPDVSLTER